MGQKKGQLICMYKAIRYRAGKDIKQEIHQERICFNWFHNTDKNSETLLLQKSGTLWVSKRLKRVV